MRSASCKVHSVALSSVLRSEAVAVEGLGNRLEHIRPRPLHQQRLTRREVPQKQTRVIQVRNLNLPGPALAPAPAPAVVTTLVPSPPLSAVRRRQRVNIWRCRQINPRNRRRGLRQHVEAQLEFESNI